MFNLRQIIFLHVKDLNAHIDSHDRRKCQKCQIYFHSVADLKKHICNGDTKHTCKTCGKSFSGEAYMKKHIHLVHEGNKPFKSESCNSYQPAKSNQDFTNSE